MSDQKTSENTNSAFWLDNINALVNWNRGCSPPTPRTYCMHCSREFNISWLLISAIFPATLLVDTVYWKILHIFATQNKKITSSIGF